MVDKIHYRWDFIGLSTDTKPTPAESPKVVDGSTYYESDTSKLYVFYKDTWYEKTATGGGASYTAGDGIDITNNEISVDTTTIQPKLTAGTNITIDEDNVISAEGGGATVVQTTGTSTTDVMSQKATTDMVYGNADRPTSQHRSVILGGAYSPINTDNIGIGYHANPGANSSGSTDNISLGQNSRVNGGKSWAISIGWNAYAGGNYGVSIGPNSNSSANNGLSIGYSAYSAAQNAVAIGYGSNATEVGQFDISTGTNQTAGYNSSNYRLLTGLYDPQNAHDAATKGYVDTKLGNLSLVSISQTDYDALTTKDPNTLYIITGA